MKQVIFKAMSRYFVFGMIAVSAFVAESILAEKFTCPVAWKDKVFTGLQLFEGHPQKKFQLKPDNGDDPLPHFWSLSGTSFSAVCEYRPLGTDVAPMQGIIHVIKGKPKNCLTEKASKEEGVYRVLNCE